MAFTLFADISFTIRLEEMSSVLVLLLFVIVVVVIAVAKQIVQITERQKQHQLVIDQV